MVKNSDAWRNKGIAHVGAILARIRESRNLTKSDLEMLSGIDLVTILRLENEGTAHKNKPRKRSFDSYIEGIQKSRNPLTKDQIEFLNKLSKYSDVTHISKSEELFNAVQLYGSANYKNTNIKSLADQLEQENNPACIVDPLWFVHAMNGSMVRLFGIDPISGHLERWDSWHVIATKFHRDSVVRKAHYNPDIYFPPVIDKFFTDDTTSPYMFTLHMRLLLQRIHKLSEQFGYSFTSWWEAAISLSLPYELEHLNRIVKYEGQRMVVQAAKPKRITVEIDPGSKIKFSILSWEPLDSKAEDVIKKISSFPSRRRLFFAADYDKNHDFHICDWTDKLEEGY